MTGTLRVNKGVSLSNEVHVFTSRYLVSVVNHIARKIVLPCGKIDRYIFISELFGDVSI